MFANQKLVLRSYTSLYGIFMSASLTLFCYITDIVKKYTSNDKKQTQVWHMRSKMSQMVKI